MCSTASQHRRTTVRCAVHQAAAAGEKCELAELGAGRAKAELAEMEAGLVARTEEQAIAQVTFVWPSTALPLPLPLPFPWAFHWPSPGHSTDLFTDLPLTFH